MDKELTSGGSDTLLGMFRMVGTSEVLSDRANAENGSWYFDKVVKPSRRALAEHPALIGIWNGGQ